MPTQLTIKRLGVQLSLWACDTLMVSMKPVNLKPLTMLLALKRTIMVSPLPIILVLLGVLMTCQRLHIGHSNAKNRSIISNIH